MDCFIFKLVKNCSCKVSKNQSRKLEKVKKKKKKKKDSPNNNPKPGSFSAGQITGKWGLSYY